MNHLSKTDHLNQLLQLACTEVSHIVPDISLTIQVATDLPTIEPPGYFVKVDPSPQPPYLYWIEWTKDLGAWIASDGRQAKILIHESLMIDQVDHSLITCLASHIAATCLCLKGTIAIHANVIRLDGKTIAFAGDSGRGKSTLTTYCINQGAQFITDDVLSFDQQGFVRPGRPRVKLFQSTGEHFNLQTPKETNYKIYYSLEDLGIQICDSPQPLDIIYLLEESEDKVYSEILPPGQAMISAMKHSYHTSSIIQDKPEIFDLYMNLIEKISIRKLFYPRAFIQLPEVYSFISKESQALLQK
jgi:hypothetical protein